VTDGAAASTGSWVNGPGAGCGAAVEQGDGVQAHRQPRLLSFAERAEQADGQGTAEAARSMTVSIFRGSDRFLIVIS